jgi:hypothetical protein
MGACVQRYHGAVQMEFTAVFSQEDLLGADVIREPLELTA